LSVNLNFLGEFMADSEDKVQDNVDGNWYVDTQCIDCDLCRTTAPDNFKQNPDEGYSYVYKQPENDEEKKLCEQAMEECPVEAIGDDG
jgi:ferredoxin